MLTRKKNKQNRHRKTKRQDGGLFRSKEIEEFKTFVKNVVDTDTDAEYKNLIDTLITKQKEWKTLNDNYQLDKTTKKTIKASLTLNPERYRFNHVKYAFDKLKKDPEKLGKFMRIAHFHSSASGPAPASGPGPAPAPASGPGSAPAPASASAEDTKTLDLLYHYNEPFEKKKEHTIKTIKELLQNCHKLYCLLKTHSVMTKTEKTDGNSTYMAFIFENEKNIKTVKTFGKGELQVIKSGSDIVLENQDKGEWTTIASVSVVNIPNPYNDPVINDYDINIGQNLNYLHYELIEKACIELDNHFRNDLDVMGKFDSCKTDYKTIIEQLKEDMNIVITYEPKTNWTAYANSLVKTRMFVTSEKDNANVASFVKSYTAAIEIMVSKMNSSDYVCGLLIGDKYSDGDTHRNMTAEQFNEMTFCAEDKTLNLVNTLTIHNDATKKVIDRYGLSFNEDEQIDLTTIDQKLSEYNRKFGRHLYTLKPLTNRDNNINKRKRGYAWAMTFMPMLYKAYERNKKEENDQIIKIMLKLIDNLISRDKNMRKLTKEDQTLVKNELKQMCYANYNPNHQQFSEDGRVYLHANRYLEYISTNLGDVIISLNFNSDFNNFNKTIWNKMYPDKNPRPKFDEFTNYVLTDVFKRSFFFLFITKDLSEDNRKLAILICNQIYNNTSLTPFLNNLTTDVLEVLRDKIKKELTSKSRSTPSPQYTNTEFNALTLSVGFAFMTFLFESIVPVLVALLAEATIPGVGIVLALLIYKSKHTRSKLFSHLKYHISRRISNQDKNVLADPEVLFYMKLQNPDLYSYILTENYTDSEQDSLTKFFEELEGFETKVAKIADDSYITSLGLPELQSKGGKGAGKKKKRGKKKRPAKIVVKKAFRD